MADKNDTAPDAAGAKKSTGKPAPEGSLSRLGRDLYQREETEEIRMRREELGRLGVREPDVSKLEKPSRTSSGVQFANVLALRTARQRRLLLWGGAGVIILGLFAGAVFGTLRYRQSRQVTADQIELTLNGPTEFAGGGDIQYEVRFRNASRVDWQAVEIFFEAPLGFTLGESSRQATPSGRQLQFSIGELASGAEDSVRITGQLVGEQGAAVSSRAEIVLSPSNFPGSRFSETQFLTTTITSTPLEVAVDAAGDAASGERVQAIIHVRNLSTEVLEGGYVALRPGAGVTLNAQDASFSPDFSTVDSLWELPPLQSLDEVQRTVIFSIQGQPGEQRILEVQAGIRRGEDRFVQRTVTHTLRVSSTELLVSQTYNGAPEGLVVKAGETVRGTVKYQNVGTVGLSNVRLEVAFEGTGLDPATLRLSSGAYDPVARKIIWSPATVPALGLIQPQQSGEITYQFNILPVTGFPAKNNALTVTATIDSPDLPAPVGQERRVISDRFVISVNSDIILQADAFYDDGRLGLPSAGPIPPRSAEQTTYTVRLRAGSTLNDLGNLRLVAVLPDGVRYTGNNFMTGGDLAFNDRTGEITWTLPFVEGGIGRLKPAEELHVQVAIVPAEHQRGDEIVFLNSLTAQADDLFTDQLLRQELKEFPTTETAVPKKGEVQ